METGIAGRSAEQPFIDPLVATCCAQFQLSRAEGAAFVKLLSGDFVSHKELHAAVASKPGAHPKTVAVVISRLRKKLADRGIKIITVYGLGGYRLDRNTRALLAITPEIKRSAAISGRQPP
jgi:DNA-binding winged helix-turn-helix (wHTH) protein